MTWREFFDSKRDRPAWHDRMSSKEAALSAKGEFTNDSLDHYRLFDDEYVAAGVEGARSLAFEYGWYRQITLDDGEEPSEFERPTAEGWE